MRTLRKRSDSRRGFTLVELLVVIAIIAILASLAGFAAYSALAKARETALLTELAQLQTAIEKYKDAHNGYPPDFTVTDPNRTLVLRHITNSYQRLNLGERNLIANSLTTGNNVAIDPAGRWLENIDSAEALVFWLGELYEHNQYPVTGVNATAQKVTQFFEFDKERLRDEDGDGWMEYYPSKRPEEPPYVYFHHQTYPAAFYVYGNKGEAIAYLTDEANPADVNFFYKWANPQKFQIICCGLDGRFNARVPPVAPAAYPRFPSGQNYDMANGELDNMTNFSEGKLEDKIDQ